MYLGAIRPQTYGGYVHGLVYTFCNPRLLVWTNLGQTPCLYTRLLLQKKAIAYSESIRGILSLHGITSAYNIVNLVCVNNRLIEEDGRLEATKNMNCGGI